MQLNVNWYRGGLYLWGWRAEQQQQQGEDARRRLMNWGELRAVIGEVSAEPLLASVGTDSALSMWLPKGVVCAKSGASAELVKVDVVALEFAAADAIDLLLSLQQREARGLGDSILSFGKLARFVIDRLARQQFFPDVATSAAGTPPVATWRVLIGGEEELEGLEAFAEAMPPSVRAVVAEQGEDAPTASAIVQSFLAATAEAIIRRDVSNDEFFSTVHARANEMGAPVEVKWLSALLGNEKEVKGRSDEIAGFVEQVRRWIGKLDESGASTAVRLCFTLIEPASDDDEVEDVLAGMAGDVSQQQRPWRLKFSLQIDNEGELVDAENLWHQRADAPGILGRNVINRRAQLMAELARAAETYPELQRALSEPEPSELKLSTHETHIFLRQHATVLQERAFGVMLPSWVTRRDRELGLLLSVAPENGLMGDDDDDDEDGEGMEFPGRKDSTHVSSGRFGLENLLDFDWQIAVGDLRLSLEEFKSLVSRGSPLVKYKGQWMQINTEAAERAAEFLKKKPKGKMTLAEAFRTAYGAQRIEAGLPVVGLVGSDWIKELLEQSPDSKVRALEQPRGFGGTLRAYQRRGLDWLSFLDRLGIGACLADDMGLGKTIQLIALLLHERQNGGAGSSRPKARAEEEGGETPPQQGRNGRGKEVRPTLLFAPTSVVGNWVREIERFAPMLKVLVHHGPERLSGDTFLKATAKHDVVITSYALAHRDIDDLKKAGWGRIALDEAQKIKNPSAASTLAIRSLWAPRRVALTGTPIENHLSELWSIMEVLNPGLLGAASEFRERFAVPIEKLQDQDRAGQLRKMIQPFVLRRTKSDPLIAGDLPEKMEFKVYCNLTPEQAVLYERVTGEMLGQIDTATGIRRRGLILAALTKLKQICNHPELLNKEATAAAASGAEIPQLSARSGKCERLVEMLEEVLEEGDAALIFTQYREMGHLLERMLTARLNAPIQFLHGGTPAKKRDEMIQRFQAPKSDVKLFLLSLRAGGLGLNLTAANHVFHFDRWWNPAVESQATDRAHRIGQTRKVQVHKFVCVGTMEERIDKLLSDKVMLADRIVASGDEWLTNLSTNELREYLALGRDAVGDF